MSLVGVVLRKELRETLRDRRTLAVMVLLPLVVYPLVSLLATEVLAAKRMAEEARPSRVAVTGTDAAAVADVRARLSRSPEIALAPAAAAAPVGPATAAAVASAAAEAVRAGAVDADVLAAPRRAHVVYDQTREPSMKAEERLRAALGAALPPGCAPSYTVDSASVAGKRQVGAYVLSKILPLLVVLMTMLGAFYPAIDITAGERERGTLETLLASPVRRLDLMTGKVLAASVLAALTGVLNIAAMSLTVTTGARLMGAAGALEIPWTRAAATVLTVMPAAFLFAAMMVAIGTLARSFKEAQNLLAPVYFLCLVPSLVAAMADFPLRGATLLVPGVNVTLLARDVMLGAASPLPTAVVLISTAAYGGLALALAARLYDSERLLAVPDADRMPLGGWLRHLVGLPARGGAPGGAHGTPDVPAAMPAPAPMAADVTAGHAVALAAVAWVLWFFLLSSLQRWRLVPGLLLTQGGFAALVAAYARACQRPVRDVIALRRPGGAALAGGALIGLSGWVILGTISERFFPPPPQLLEEMRRLIHPPGGRPLAASLLVFAIAPAVCEEALFRGPILRGLAQRFPPAAACLLTGVMFGLFHGDVWRFLPTAALGTTLSWVALASGSVLPSMLAHLANNAALVILGHFDLDQRAQAMPWNWQAGLMGAAAAAALLGVVAVHKGKR